MKVLAIAAALLLFASSCGFETVTGPGAPCQSSRDCPAPQRCFFPAGNTLASAFCERPGASCSPLGHECPTGTSCAESIEAGGRGVDACQADFR